MIVEHIELLVEEPSTAEALRVLLPRILGHLSFEVHSHQGKHDLLGRLPIKLRGYAHWIPQNWRIVMIVDRDDDDCEVLKSRLEKIAAEAGLVTRQTAGTSTWVLANRIAVEELEAWYFGDWHAVKAAYPNVATGIPGRAPFRNSDEIKGGTWEAFERVLQQAGYFDGGLRKIEAARTIAAHMDPDRNRSPSFRALRNALRDMSAT
jgi:hypothetical protein